MRGRAWTAIAVVCFAFVGGSSRANADEKGMCSEKYQDAQRMRASGKLLLARADLLRCAEQACPPFVSNDCKTWLAQVETDIPTLVFAVLDPDGHDVPSAVIRVDGADVPSATDGLGHPVDPGNRLVEAYARGQVLRQQVVVRVGEKSRRIELRLAGAPSSTGASPASSTSPASSASSSSTVTTTPATTTESGGVPAGAFVLGGIGLVGIGVGSVLWVTGSSAAQTYNNACESGAGCTQSQRDNVRNQLIGGDAAWGVGLAAAIATVAVILVHHGGGATTAVSFGPSGVSVAGRF
jgi:hypothetical protein